MSDIELPDLPTPRREVTEEDIGDRVHTSFQIRDYATAALLADREKRAQAAQGEIDRERWLAIREGHLNAADAEYFGARPQLDNAHNHRIFYAGFCKGYDATEASKPVQAEAPTVVAHGLEATGVVSHESSNLSHNVEAPTASNAAQGVAVSSKIQAHDVWEVKGTVTHRHMAEDVYTVDASREDDFENWYITMTHPDGCRVYDGYWQNSGEKTAEEVMREAIHGACLPAAPTEAAAPTADCVGGSPCTDCPSKKQCQRGCIRQTDVDHVSQDRKGWEAECNAVDALLRGLGLDPDRCRTEGGALNVGRALSLLSDTQPPSVEAVMDLVAKYRAVNSKSPMHEQDAYRAVLRAVGALATQPTASNAGEREAFEAAAREEWDGKSIPDAAWIGWQLRAALAQVPKQVAGDSVERWLRDHDFIEEAESVAARTSGEAAK